MCSPGGTCILKHTGMCCLMALVAFSQEIPKHWCDLKKKNISKHGSVFFFQNFLLFTM